ncbi:MAG: M4 family metallopeptidase [Gammaproteobacteria bacterium]|nr:M4 family metallopeptidase [Gammaproteobacteria bacterium]
MKLRIISLLVINLFSALSFSASEQLVWGNAEPLLAQYTAKKIQGVKAVPTLANQSDYQIKPMEIDSNLNSNHIRYQLYYKNIPIWGYQLILHKTNNSADYLTGVDASGIEKDVTHVEGKLSAEEVEKKILETNKDKIIFKNIEKIIYLDSNTKAYLAYQLSMYTNNPDTFVASLQYIVDANSGEILKQWDDLTHKKMGQGLGGNVFALPYRSGLFQHGNAYSDIPSLGKFDVTEKGGKCYLETPEIRVINVAKTNMDKSSFPVLSIVEAFKKPPTFSYTCNRNTNYVNKNDGNTSPANFSFSSVNDTMYFAGITLDMYKEYYGIANPVGHDLPVRAYTHIKNFDNAFAVPSVKIKGVYIIHQQIVIGDGDKVLTAPAQGTLSHELSHNVTRLYSNLVYSGQSGGINEAFSDMASIAMQDYLRKDYPWYWDGMDWAIGREATIGSEPIRYMDDPMKDGKSIDNALLFNDTLDVHQTSGVFNKAFYLLAHQSGWSVRQAFQVMLDANIKYWTSGTHFEAAACGVIQAAIDRKYNKKGVIEAFAQVGVICPLRSLVD